ncbi:MAG: ABC transporter ATP-binding protein [Dictyoglomaceae bacterium]
MKKEQGGDIFKLIKKNIFLFLIISFLSIIVSFINVSLINFEKDISDAILGKNREVFTKIFWIVCSIMVLKIFLEYIKAYLIGKFIEKVLINIRLKIAEKLNKIKLYYIEKNTTGDLVSTISNDLSLIQNFLGNLGDILYQPVSFILGLILAFTINWKLTLFSFAVIPLCFTGAILISKPVEKYTKRHQDVFGYVNTVFQDALSGIIIVKSFNLKDEISKFFNNELKRAFKEGIKSIKFEALLDPVKGIIQIGPFLLMFLYGGDLVIRGEMTVGGIVAFIEIMNIFLNPVNTFPNILNNYQKAKAGLKRIEDILSQEEEKNGVIKEEDKKCQYAIEFQNVYFSYDRTNEVLKDISFSIKKGEKVAIVGGSGSGKSTIIKLILGLYKPTKGNIKILGVNINDWDLYSLREKISVANQDIYLFPESVKENIRYGKYFATDEEIKEVTLKMLAYDFIVSDLGGFEEEIGERGLKLSGGEKQRIALSRFLLRDNCEIYLLDEATSALDAETEIQIQNILKEELKNKTVLISAHRFSSIKFVDRILVLDKGKIVEEGTHEELLNRKGIYYKLYFKQLENNSLFERKEFTYEK